MNGMATVSNFFVPNLCNCGHDLVVHNMAVTPNTCSMCIRQSGVQNTHNFASDLEVWPAPSSPQTAPARFVCAGGFGFGFSMTTGAGNAKGSTSVLFLAAIDRIQIGMTFTTVAANAANSVTYTVIGTGPGLQVQIAAPGLLFNSPGILCLFQGNDGSTMGPGLPPNGQRAG